MVFAQFPYFVVENPGLFCAIKGTCSEEFRRWMICGSFRTAGGELAAGDFNRLRTPDPLHGFWRVGEEFRYHPRRLAAENQLVTQF
jgi:hypothetical protein